MVNNQSSYYLNNRDRILKKVKEYRNKNVEKIKKYKKEYNERNKNYYKEYHFKYRTNPLNKEKIQQYRKEYWEKNKEQLKEQQKKRYLNLPFEKRVKIIEQHKEYYKNNKDKYKYKYKDKRNQYLEKYYKNNIQYRIAVITRSKINKAIREYLEDNNQIYKKIKYLIGLPIQDYIKYIETKFHDGMNWDNRGILWNIDHILSVASFDLTNEIELKKCFNYLNTRPVFIKDNHIQGIIF